MNIQTEDEKEYWRNVSSQEDLPLSGEENLLEMEELNKLVNKLQYKKEHEQVDIIKKDILADPTLFHRLRLFVGISDKRAYLDLSYLFRNTDNPSKAGTLCGCNKDDLNAHGTDFFVNMVKEGKYDTKQSQKAAEIITHYLQQRGLRSVLEALAMIPEKMRETIIKNTILPREVQQSEAKRRGHGAEGEFARVVKELGCNLLPVNKDTNPMGAGDIRLDKKKFSITTENSENTRSYDMIICNSSNKIRMGVIGLIHSSDPGEYGVAKAERTGEYKSEIKEYNLRQPKDGSIFLCALVDGVGFSENKKGTINKILANVDSFVQIKTLYKIGLQLHKLGLCKLKAIQFINNFYTDDEMTAIKKKYIPNDVLNITEDSKIDPTWKKIMAGYAILYI